MCAGAADADDGDDAGTDADTDADDIDAFDAFDAIIQVVVILLTDPGRTPCNQPLARNRRDPAMCKALYLKAMQGKPASA